MCGVITEGMKRWWYHKVLNRYCTGGRDVIWNIGNLCILWEKRELYL